jgi:hypothetical protein
MSSTEAEILALEEKLRLAELGPDPEFFEKHIDKNMIFVGEGKAHRPKDHIVEAHSPGKGTKFTRVDMSEMNIVDHGNTAVVTVTGTYEGPLGTQVLKFMRVWAKKEEGWRIIAGSMI